MPCACLGFKWRLFFRLDHRASPLWRRGRDPAHEFHNHASSDWLRIGSFRLGCHDWRKCDQGVPWRDCCRKGIPHYPDHAGDDECGKKEHPEIVRRRTGSDRGSERHERRHREGSTFNTGTLTTQEGRNGTATAFIGDTATGHFWRALHKSYPPLKLIWNAPKDEPAQSVVYRTAIANFNRTATKQPIHLEVNGTTVWSSDGVAIGDTICVEIDAVYTRPGLNELKWVYDTDVPGNWVTFEYHKLRMGVPGMVISVK